MAQSVGTYEIIRAPLRIHDHLCHSEQLGMYCQLIRRHGLLFALDFDAIPAVTVTGVYKIVILVTCIRISIFGGYYATQCTVSNHVAKKSCLVQLHFAFPSVYDAC